MAAARSLALLTGPEAGELLAAALAPVGGEVLSWQTSQVDHQPQRGTTAGYRVRWPGGQVTDERFAACTGRIPAGALVLGAGAERVALWRFPHDPYLPALAAAYDPAAVVELLRDLGLGSGPPRLLLRAYRPRRRAVIEVVGARNRLFLKVVRPRRVAGLQRKHRRFVEAGVPAPPSLGYAANGLLVLQALPGRALREVLRDPGAPVPGGTDLLALLDRLPPELVEEPPRMSWLDRVDHYAAVVAGSLPSAADQAGGLPQRSARRPAPARPCRCTATSMKTRCGYGQAGSAGCWISTPRAPGTGSTTWPACSGTCRCWRNSSRRTPARSTDSARTTWQRSNRWWTRPTCGTSRSRSRWRP